MKNIEAFAVFAKKILEGQEGVFWSERDVDGKERFVFGYGEKKESDFLNGDYPLFSSVDFEGVNNKVIHFKSSYSSDDLPNDECRMTNVEFNNNLSLSGLDDLESFSNEDEQSFCSKIEKVKEYARNGELWVLNLAQEFSGKCDDWRVLLSGFYDFLKLNKAHVGGVWVTSDLKFCSMSPEVFLRQKGRSILTFPIKGTNKEVDRLRSSDKEVS
ncbi:MAG: chorismate-binding protein, partial [Candidatus Peregrinibacteria bacterium]|nr:chorismate-binding protein [Candidatus Peregrinibacteria bacterium]